MGFIPFSFDTTWDSFLYTNKMQFLQLCHYQYGPQEQNLPSTACPLSSLICIFLSYLISSILPKMVSPLQAVATSCCIFIQLQFGYIWVFNGSSLQQVQFVALWLLLKNHDARKILQRQGGCYAMLYCDSRRYSCY